MLLCNRLDRLDNRSSASLCTEQDLGGPGRGMWPLGRLAAAMLWPCTEPREEAEGDGTDDEVGVPVSDGGSGSPIAMWIFRSCSCEASSVHPLQQVTAGRMVGLS